MHMRSTARRLVVAVLAFSCVSLAVAFPGWRANLAHAGYSYLGCAEDRDTGDFNVVLSDGDPTIATGGACDAGLSNLLAEPCSVVAEDQFVTDRSPSFASFYRLFCPD